MDIEKAHILISKYQNGDITEEELQQLFIWLDEQDAELPAYQFTDLAGEERLKAEIAQGIKQSLFMEQEKPKTVKWGYFVRIAAIALIVIGAAFWGIKRIHQPTISYTRIISPAGQLKIVNLPDGSRVYLNASSQLVYNSRFGADNREIKLDGEAYFEVRHRKDLPFIVQSRHLKTQVLGTRFDIKAYDDEPEILVSVNSGMVGVMNGKSTVFLTMNQLARFNDHRQLLTKEPVVNAADLNAWTDGSLLFNHESLDKIVRTLSRRYGKSVIIQNKNISGTLLNAHFDKSESFENVLNVLCAYVGARYKHSGDQYLIN